MTKRTRDFVKNESGATAIEYGLIAALVAVGLIAALTVLGDKLGDLFKPASDATAVSDQNSTTAPPEAAPAPTDTTTVSVTIDVVPPAEGDAAPAATGESAPTTTPESAAAPSTTPSQ